ncbi:MAG: PilZ domain-containing protein [Nitrospiraceae bacterium]
MDLRLFPRFLIKCPIAFIVNSHRAQGSLVNLSMSGCGAESSDQVQARQHLALLLHLPDNEPPMEVDLATVRWSQGQQFGLEFMYVRPEERDRLRQFIRTMETGTAHQGPPV